MPRTHTQPLEDEVTQVSAYHSESLTGYLPKSLVGWNKVKRALRWVLTVLPLVGVIWASFLPLQTWMQQALILVALIWFYVFYLLDTFFMGG